MKDLTLIIPVHNEEGNIPKLAAEIEGVFRLVNFNWEVIWVDDGSQDGTSKIIESVTKTYPQQSCITLPRQCGQSAAVLSGIQRSHYPLIATLDGDCQNDPRDLLTLKGLLEDHDYKLVQGVRVQRRDSGIRLFSTKVTNLVRNAVLGVQLNDVGCAVRVFKKEALVGFPAFRGWHRFLPVMMSLLYPGQVAEYPVNHRQRLTGRSNYGIGNRLWVGIFDLLGIMWFKKRGFLIPQFEK